MFQWKEGGVSPPSPLSFQWNIFGVTTTTTTTTTTFYTLYYMRGNIRYYNRIGRESMVDDIYNQIKHIEGYHLCISCENLVSIYRKKILHKESRRLTGYTHVARCTHARYERSPWSPNTCPFWKECAGQRHLRDYARMMEREPGEVKP